MAVYSYTLPIEKYAEELRGVINKNQRIIIKGPTGCGKSTFIPLLLKDKKVAIIEPRRIAVTALYNILKQHIPTVGYKMRFSRALDSSTTTTIFTDGAFLNEISELEYDYIIVDEVHERNTRTDIILGILKESFKGKLILMSATLDTARLESFFSAITFNIPGQSYPVKIHYLTIPTQDYITECYMTIKRILKESHGQDTGCRDILVFLPGEEDINELHHACKRIPSVLVYKVHSKLSDLEQQRIFEERPSRRVILSTNICESSLTIPNIKYVIDTGLCKVKIFDGISKMGIVSASRESIIQRMGRSNRFGPGVCYRLYTEFCIFSKQVPEIEQVDLSSVLLRLIDLDKNILEFPFINQPPLANCVHALWFLHEKRCIEIICDGKRILDKDTVSKYWPPDAFVDFSILMGKTVFRITSYGKRLLRHPFDVHLAHFYEQCIIGDVGYYGSILVSLMSQDNYNFLGKSKDKTSDLRQLIGLMEGYIGAVDKKQYAIERNLPIKGLEVSRKICKSLNKSKKGNIEMVERIFSKAFYHNVCVCNGDGSYTMKRNGTVLYVHPSSGFFRKREKEIVIVDISEGSKVYARIVGKYFKE